MPWVCPAIAHPRGEQWHAGSKDCPPGTWKGAGSAQGLGRAGSQEQGAERDISHPLGHLTLEVPIIHPQSLLQLPTLDCREPQQRAQGSVGRTHHPLLQHSPDLGGRGAHGTAVKPQGAVGDSCQVAFSIADLQLGGSWGQRGPQAGTILRAWQGDVGAGKGLEGRGARWHLGHAGCR